jgi:hypothetical protein
MFNVANVATLVIARILEDTYRRLMTLFAHTTVRAFVFVP